MTSITWSATVDWVCVGSGAGGCGAAIAGHDQGFTTLLVEQSRLIGGVTAGSGGILWVPLNHLQAEAGIDDSREAALAYLRYMGAEENQPEYMAAYVDHAARVLQYLHTHAQLDCRLMELAEFYHPIAPGSMPFGRLLICEPFPAETLGNWRDQVRLSPYYHSLAHVLQGHNPALGGSDGPQVGHSGPARDHPAGLAAWRQRPDWPQLEATLHHDEAHRVAGAALIGYLFRAVLRRGIDVRTKSRVERLILDGDRVVGITLVHNNQEEHIQARRGVVIATSSGDGWRMTIPAGADMTSVIIRQGMLRIHVPGEQDLDGAPLFRGNYELRMRHGLVVNRQGQRFGNEAFFQDIGSRLHDFETWGSHRFTNLPCYLIFDQTLLDTYSFVGLPPGTTTAIDWVTQSETLAGLAEQLAIHAETLQATVARFNAYAEHGSDPDFSRDAATLGPLTKPPFYGVELTAPSVTSAVIGLVANSQGQVLHHRTGHPIPGLYACGQVVETNRTFGIGYQAGLQLMRSLISGFLAAEHAAATGLKERMT